MDYISHTVILGIITAVALIIIISATSDFLGVLSNLGEPFFIRLYQVLHDVPRANVFALIVGGITVISGLIFKQFWKRYALVAAVTLGTLSSLVINALVGPANTGLESIGYISMSLFPLSSPNFDMESIYVLKELVISAFSIAFLGLMQSIVIARSIAIKSGQRIDSNQEIIGQGLSNIVAPFLSSFASSGSFNRSAAHYDAGAQTPMAAIYASILLGVLVYSGSTAIAYIPMAAVAGALILVGIGLVDVKAIRHVFRTKRETVIFFMTLMTALFFGLNAGVFMGLFLSLTMYLWSASMPKINVTEHTARDGRQVKVVGIEGNCFFGSIRHIDTVLHEIKLNKDGLILLRTDHLTYLDVPGAEHIAAEARRRREQDNDLYLYVSRQMIIEVLEKSGCIELLGNDHIIYKDRDHILKDVLYPNQAVERKASRSNVDFHKRSIKEEEPMQALVQRIRTTRVLGSLTTQQLSELLTNTEIQTAQEGDIIITEDKESNDHLIVIEGELEAQRTWSTQDGKVKSYTWHLKPNSEDDSFAFLASCNGVRARAVTDVKYLNIDADRIDSMLGWSQQFADLIDSNPEFKNWIELFRNISVLQLLPLENIKTAFQQLKEMKADAGDTIITQGDKGDRYFLIVKGEAEVYQADAFTDEIKKVNQLGPGDAFGEEALVQDGFRSATIIMKTPGDLLTLSKEDFDDLIKPGLVSEIEAGEALDLVNNKKAYWLDCRYDLEYEESRIPHASLIPLDRIRWDTHKLKPNEKYIVYCRSGRRSKAAAFLLRERNFDAISLTGGIKNYPFEIDMKYIDTSEDVNT